MTATSTSATTHCTSRWLDTHCLANGICRSVSRCCTLSHRFTILVKTRGIASSLIIHITHSLILRLLSECMGEILVNPHAPRIKHDPRGCTTSGAHGLLKPNEPSTRWCLRELGEFSNNGSVPSSSYAGCRRYNIRTSNLKVVYIERSLTSCGHLSIATTSFPRAALGLLGLTAPTTRFRNPCSVERDVSGEDRLTSDRIEPGVQ